MSSTKRDYILALIMGFGVGRQAAKDIVDALIQEGVVNEHYGNEEISSVIEAFKHQFGTTSASRYDRFAANRLVKKHGVETVIRVISALASLQDREFCPSVNNVSETERKWVSIIRFLKSQKQEDGITDF